MPSNGKGKQGANRLSGIEINPIPVIVIAVLLAVGLGWFFWLKPQRDADKAAQEWTSPEAAAARAPENRPKDPAHDAVVQDLLQKEGHADRTHRRRDEQ